jgi:hypothetical protein
VGEWATMIVHPSNTSQKQQTAADSKEVSKALMASSFESYSCEF